MYQSLPVPRAHPLVTTNRPNTLRSTHHAAEFVRRHFLTFLLGAYVVSAVFPMFGIVLRTPFSPGSSVSFVHIMISVLLLTLGLSTPITDAFQIVRELRWVGTFFVIRMLLALLLAGLSLALPSAASGILVGYILLLSAPTAASSAGWSLQLGSSKATTTSLIFGSTLLCILASPLLIRTTSWLSDIGTGSDLLPFAESFRIGFVLPWVLLPMVIGMVARSLAPSFAQRVRKMGLQLTPFILLLLNYSNASTSLPKLATEMSAVSVVLILMGCVAVFLLLSSLSWLSSSILSATRTQRISALVGTSMSNTGLLLVIASLAMPDRIDIHLPIIAYTFIQHLGVARFAKTPSVGSTADEQPAGNGLAVPSLAIDRQPSGNPG